MKKIKYFLLVMVSFVLALSMARVFSPPTSQKAHGEQIPSSPVLSYVSLSIAGKPLTYDNLKAVDTTYYIFATGSVTINFKPLIYNYSVNEALYLENFSKKATTIEIPIDEGGSYDRFFEYKGVTYYFRILSGICYIYYTEPATSSASAAIQTNRTQLVSYTQDVDKITISITESYTLKSNIAGSVYNFPFAFGVYTTQTSIAAQTFSLMFTRPSINFLTDSPFQFESHSQEFDNGGSQIDDGLMPEQSLNRLKLTFLNSKYNYTEETPLYFNINYNGFVYNFTLYIQDNYLFVNYTDENKEENNRELATKMVSTGVGLDGTPNLTIDTSSAIPKTDNFSMTFNKIGRYFIEIFDDSYAKGMGNTNYYSTSFYIKEESTMSTGNTAFDNIYIVSQVHYYEDIPSQTPTTPDETETTPPATEQRLVDDYIVDTSTQNHPVRSTIKNLIPRDNSGLKDTVEYVLIAKTLFGANNNITFYDAYIPKGGSGADSVKARDGIALEHLTIYENLEEITDNDEFVIVDGGDVQLNFNADGYYQIFVVSTPNNVEEIKETSYSFFIVTTAKANYTIDGVKYEATEDYVTQVRYYDESITNTDLTFTINYASSGDRETNLNKTYVNHYSVSYGRQKVNVSAVFGDGSITITCQGIGDLNVNITFNGETTPYVLNSEEGNGSITFYDYGTYVVSLVDSMGTASGEQSFTLAKGLNVSSIVLIALSSVILLVITTFVLISRAKPKTR